MREAGIHRLICLSSAGLVIHNDTPWMARQTIKHVIQPMFKYAYEDMSLMGGKLQKSRLNWTIIRPPRLTNGQKSGTFRTAINGHLSKARSITRADLANYMINSIFDEESYQAIVEISN